MTSLAMPRRRAWGRQSVSTWLPTAVALTVVIVGLITGYALKVAVEQRTDVVTHGALTVNVPAGWILDRSDEMLVASDPRDPSTRLFAGAAALPAAGDLAAFAVEDVIARRGLSLAFAIEDERAFRVGNRDGVLISYGFSSRAAQSKDSTRQRGRALYLPDGSSVLVTAYEAPENTFTRGVDRFYRFADSARAGQP